MSDEKKRVNVEDLPVPLKELDKEEEDNVTGGIGVLNPTSPISSPTNPTTTDLKNPTISPLNPGNKTFNP
ncbi:MAG TPA: hypothetical protein VJU86_15725 [Pyrinomonadaceae bacterium]|nr:hypothetical protein [Pyrinomonadaceae bacterium]